MASNISLEVFNKVKLKKKTRDIGKENDEKIADIKNPIVSTDKVVQRAMFYALTSN